MKISKEKIATAIRNNKFAIGASLVAQTAMLPTISAFAAETESFDRAAFRTELSSGLQNGFNGMILDLVAYITTVLPLALTVFGAFWGTKKAIGFFRTTAKG